MIRYTLAIAVALAFTVPTVGSAQTNDELTQRLAELEARLNQMEQEQVSFVNTIATAPVCATDTCGDACTSCGDTCCNSRSWCCPEAGAFGEIELLYMSQGGSDNDSASSPVSATRTTAGYMNDKGRGFQIRYFEIDAESGGEAQDGDASGFNLDTLDFEYVSRFSMGCNWRGDIGMGLRWMDLSNGAGEVFEDMVGPVIGISLLGEMTDKLSVYSRVRQSFVYGGGRNGGNYDGNIVVPISELAMGLEYAQPLNSSELFVRGGVEGQVFFDTESNEESQSLFGIGMSVGLRR